MPMPWWGISVVTLLLIFAFIMNISLYRRLNRRMKRFEASSITLQTFLSGHQLDTLLQECVQKLVHQEQLYNEISTRLTRNENKLRDGVDRAELLRFKAFENVGSDLSFALALLNQDGNGVILSSIHSREESRVYAKPVKAGISTYSLTGEEKEVINRAMHGQKI